MGSWSPGALESYQADCIARGGTIVEDPLMAVRCVEPPAPVGDTPIPLRKKGVTLPITKAPIASNMNLEINTILIIIVLVLVLSLSVAVGMLMR